MSYRCLMIVNPARIRCKNEQLLIETEEAHSYLSRISAPLCWKAGKVR